MNTEKIHTDSCPNCNHQVIIPNDWITIKNDRIASIDADWRCFKCGDTGKLDIGGTTNDHWQPRDIVIGRDIPETPRPGDLERATPERRAVEFLDYWKQDDYKGMGELIPPSEGVLDYEAPELTKDFYRPYQLNHFVLQGINDKTPMLTDVKVRAEMIQLGSEVKQRGKFE